MFASALSLSLASPMLKQRYACLDKLLKFPAGKYDDVIDMMALLSTHSLLEVPLAPPLVTGGVNSFTTERNDWGL